MNKNKIVLFSNLKGGTGKSTLCELFATYCVEKELPIVAMDADPQLSLWKDRKDDLAEKPEAETQWSVTPIILNETLSVVLAKLREIEGVVLIDCPGNVDNPYLQLLFKEADIIVIPFRYDRKNVRETASFCEILRKHSKARLIFVPNLVTYTEGMRDNLKKARENAYTHFGRYGFITPRILERVAIRDCDTLSMKYEQRKEVRYAFDKIIETVKSL